jgi:hypothetical protein
MTIRTTWHRERPAAAGPGSPRERQSATAIAGRFALASLATWRVAHLLAEEDGPWDAVVWLRARAGNGALGDLMDCFYCLSVWVAAPLCATTGRRQRDLPLTWLALSGAACLLERVTAPPEPDAGVALSDPAELLEPTPSPHEPGDNRSGDLDPIPYPDPDPIRRLT